MIEKWYRGHEGSNNATDNFGIIWLADDPEYAQLYADEYPNGVVSTIFVDMDKINYLDWYYDEDFDPYDPDMFLLKNYMKEQGCNAYTFPLNDGITVLALLTTEPIVKVEKTIIENKKYRNMKIRLTESRLKQIVAESVNKVLNENEYSDEHYPGDINPKATQGFIDDNSKNDAFIDNIHIIHDCFRNIKNSLDDIRTGADIDSATKHIEWLVNRLQNTTRTILKNFGYDNTGI